MTLAALLIGVLIAAQGVFGLVAPEQFHKTIAFMQTPPAIYFAAVVRVAFGVVLFRAATVSRAPIFLRLLGAFIALGGLLTPFVGVRIGRVILDSWSEGGPATVRFWAAGSLVIGAMIMLATSQRRA